MPRTLAVRVGFTTPPALSGVANDSVGLSDAVSTVRTVTQSVADAVGLTDVVTPTLTPSGSGFGHTGFGSGPFGS